MTVGQALSGKEEIEQALDPATHNAETDPPVTHGNLRLAIMPMSPKEIAMESKVIPMAKISWVYEKRIARLFRRRRLFPVE
tara:strand:- start:173 stop:415 length:243 start_codon:yes stop_codon:yes gene_type:complete